jgi:hypothetical protein
MVVMFAVGGRAFAQDYVPPPAAKPYTVEIPGERSRSNVLKLAGVAGAGVLFGALGVYYNLDSRDASNRVSADSFTAKPWTPAQQADIDRAHDSKIKAGVFYGVGGALIIGAAIAFIITEPKSQIVEIRPHAPKATPTVAPTSGGAILGEMWTF